jgi:hypothetical protein
VLDGLRAACREQDVAESFRGDLDNQPRRFSTDVGRMGGCKRTKAVGLFLDRCDDTRVLVTEVREDQLRAEVEVSPAVGVDHVAAGAADKGRDVARPLHRPGMEDQLVKMHLALVTPGSDPSTARG